MPSSRLAALLGGGELRVALFDASTDAAAARLATGHLFEEPGALDKVARLAAAWFVTYRR